MTQKVLGSVEFSIAIGTLLGRHSAVGSKGG
jgi:hypothetical protein